MSKMDWGILSIIMIQAVLPNLYYRGISNEVLKKANTKEKLIALTFDDGPNPNYTPELLEVLKENNVKSTFFVLAENALKYPYLIKNITSQGHCIGLHSFKHKNAMLELPMQTKKDFTESVSIMNNLGIKIKLFRPPWGIFNPMTFHYAKAYNFKVILWSIHAMDWSRWVTTDFIKNRLINHVKPGDIILLHDGRGAKNAPLKTIAALKTVIPALKEKGFKFVLANELQGGNS